MTLPARAPVVFGPALAVGLKQRLRRWFRERFRVGDHDRVLWPV